LTIHAKLLFSAKSNQKLSPAPEAIKVCAKAFSLMPHQKRSIFSVFNVFTFALYKGNEFWNYRT
jgi:hypothetical protein